MMMIIKIKGVMSNVDESRKVGVANRRRKEEENKK
jgi:hypothetical protein